MPQRHNSLRSQSLALTEPIRIHHHQPSEELEFVTESFQNTTVSATITVVIIERVIQRRVVWYDTLGRQ